MKTISTRKVKQSMLRVPGRRLTGAPKTAAEIERWIVAMGGKPVGASLRSQLAKSGHWGMPRE